MSKQRILAIDYIRGISMLGVIGIHTGAYSLSNPYVNVHLFALLEIVTRFSVPIFFFASAFGMFLHQDIHAKLNYSDFMTRRANTVLVPYLVWSFLYMLHYTFISGDFSPWHLSLLYQYLLFGFSSYQLYFLVILLWFYTLMPLWRMLLRYILLNPIPNLLVLLVLQIAFNYYSSYILTANFSNKYLNLLIQHRLSYWVVHYIFIFILGAVCAVRYQDFTTLISRYRWQINTSFFFTLTSILGYYYYLLYVAGYTPEQAVNTAHQLSPIGVLYTVAATLFWFKLFSLNQLPTIVTSILSKLGEHSYIIYLFHPFAMYYLVVLFAKYNLMMTVPHTIGFYLLTVGISLLFAAIIKKASRSQPMISFLLIGSKGVKLPAK